MRAIKSRDTKPEIIVRRALHAKGYRFRNHRDDLPGKPDVVLPRFMLAIQVRGCYWHKHSCADGHIPRSRREYWLPKITGNKRRDARNDRLLRRMGWRVLVIWECECEEGRWMRKVEAICRGRN